MNAFSISPMVVERLGWVLVHSLWQFAAIALVGLLLDRLLTRRSSAIRYVALLCGLTLMVAAPVVTWAVVPDSLDTNPSADLLIVEVDRPTLIDPGLSSDADGGLESLPALASPAGSSAPGRTTADFEMTAVVAADTAAETELFANRLARLVAPWLGVIVGVWCCGVVMFSVRPVWGWFNVQRLKTVGVSPVADSAQQALKRIEQKLQIRHRVQLLQSTLVPAPVVVGCFRSVILLPASFISGVPVSQLEAILAHELAHVRRYDYLVNLLQTLVETLFFYHPAVWWVSHRIRIERENCCDDLVVAVLGNKVEYGRALLAVEEFRGAAASTLALSAKGGSLLARVRRLFSDPTRDDPRGSAGLAALAVVAAGLLVAAFWSSTGADADDEASADEKPATFVAQVTDEISIELLAIQMTEGEVLKSWKPNGGLFDEPPTLPAWRDSANRFAPGSRHLFFRWKGISESVGRTYRLPGLRLYQNTDDSGIARVIAEPTNQGDIVPVRVGITDADWGPWQKVNSQGKMIESVEVPPACRDVYELIKPDHVEARVRSCYFCWSGQKGMDERAQTDLVAVTADGQRHSYDGRTFWDSPAGTESAEVFDIPLDKIDHFEYRLRPYRYWVTFENVSLNAGQETQVNVSVETMSITDNTPASLLRSLTDEPSVELLRQLLDEVASAQPEIVELLHDSRRGSNAGNGGPITVVPTANGNLHVVLASVIPESPSNLSGIREEDSYAEAAFVFDTQGKLIVRLGGEFHRFESRFGTDNVDVVSIGPKEDWFVRVMNFQYQAEPFEYRSTYYRLANPVIQSVRFLHYPNTMGWSNGPEQVNRWGELSFDVPHANVKEQWKLTGTDKQGIELQAKLIWDGDRDRFVGAPRLDSGQTALYQVDVDWSKDFAPLTPHSDQMVIHGGARSYEHWHSWQTVVPANQESVVELAFKDRDGVAQKVTKTLAPGYHLLQLKVPPPAEDSETTLRLRVDAAAEESLSARITDEARQYAPPVTIVAVGQNLQLLRQGSNENEFTLSIRLVGAQNTIREEKQDDDQTRLPWRAHGRVVDADGRPLEGVTVVAATGVGTLKGGGRGVSDADGRYDFRFGRGVVFSRGEHGKPSPQTQSALISARLDGHFEQNSSRHGNGIASLEPVAADVLKDWGLEPDQICLPDKPREVNFVMLPAAKVSGTLVDEDDKPLKDYSVSLTGETLPPGSSALAQVRTDETGRFEITEIPTTIPYQFDIRKPRSELKPPWDDSWASGPMTFVDPGDNDLSATFVANEPNEVNSAVIRMLKLKIVGPGVHGKKAVADAARRKPPTNSIPHPTPSDGLKLQAAEFTLILSNENKAAEGRKPSGESTSNPSSTSSWKAVRPDSIAAETAESGEILDDDSVQMSLPGPNWSSSILKFDIAEAAELNALRLELLPDTRFEDRRLGRIPDRELKLFEVTPWIISVDGKARHFDWSNAEYIQNPDDAEAASLIDNATDTGWYVPDLAEGQAAHELIFHLDEPVSLTAGDTLAIEIDSGGSEDLDTLARFRVSFPPP